MSDIVTDIAALQPALLRGEFSSLTISFNDFACNYVDARTAVEEGIVPDDGWVSDAERERALERNSIWEVQWYPDTPVGFNVVRASSIEAAVAGAMLVAIGERG